MPQPSTPPSPTTITITIANPWTFAPTLATLEASIFGPDPICALAFGPERLSPTTHALRTAQLAAVPDVCTLRINRAVDAAGRVVGASYWKYWFEPWSEDEAAPKTELPPGANLAMCVDVFGRCDENRRRNMTGKAHAGEFSFCSADPVTFYLFFVSWLGFVENLFLPFRCLVCSIMMVVPDCQRMGIGSRLLEDGLRVADEAGLPTWLGASDQGLSLYLKHGFVIDEVLEVDLGKYGCEGIETQRCMVRPGRKA